MRDLERVDGHHPGVALTEKRERFIRLVSQGMSNAEASRLVGVNRKTGIRWRFGRTILNRAGEPVHYPPVRTTAHPPRSPACKDEHMADMRRRSLEPPPGAPQIQHKPGLANEMLRELAPLLAEEGIDVDDIDVPDLETLQAAMNRAVERSNMARFTPVGKAREHAVTTLRLVVDAVIEDDTTLAAAILESVPPESPDGKATVAGCIGVALGLLDDWLTGADRHAPKDLGQRVTLPSGHWLGERAATDILALARKGRAYRSLDTLLTRQGGKQVLYGSALALAAALRAWSSDTGTQATELTRATLR